MFTINCSGTLHEFTKPVVMGILNITDNSFYNQNLKGIDAILQKAQQILYEGADILDIGGQSTRPGSSRISAKQEIEKIIPVIKSITKNHPNALLSVDTYHSEVAVAACGEGVAIVNDISGGTMDTEMIKTVGRLNVPYICMHIQGTPETMQTQNIYDDIIVDILKYFSRKIQECYDAGIKDIILDPGFGFAKNIQQNLFVLSRLKIFSVLNKPLLAGISRKSTIYKTLNISADEALNGTTCLNTVALLNGASILRVHDVKEAVETCKLTEALKKAAGGQPS